MREFIQHAIDFKTKPLGSLGQLEDIALQISMMQQSVKPVLKNPHIVVFAGDHGIALEGVSAYPQEVTFQMVMNFVQGGAAINVFSQQHHIALKVVDAGVNFLFDAQLPILHCKVARGTKSFLNEDAMTDDELTQCFAHGKKIVADIHQSGCNVIGLGEMGIGNTSSASMLMHYFTGIDLKVCIGKGTGVNEEQYTKKINILEQAKNNFGNHNDPSQVLKRFGGFEIAQMIGAFKTAYELNMLILVDGFIATSAFLYVYAENNAIIDNAVFCHQSDESGHKKMLEYLQVKPILNLNMRLGEGTGCAVAYPIIESAVRFLHNMASFESAGVTNKEIAQ
jgi:nicotinate-nucleotide--dimethylbenzimidazole phosphoribosyltransferase